MNNAVETKKFIVVNDYDEFKRIEDKALYRFRHVEPFSLWDILVYVEHNSDVPTWTKSYVIDDYNEFDSSIEDRWFGNHKPGWIITFHKQ